ncbi:MBL fold metallo-hydrolase [Pseudonocardiaceae bacterium YIM PH 21723]|nr:MBL fold metallo-hydrolase [Pseudonocardiaceae bacterium YIM PH 21723]
MTLHHLNCGTMCPFGGRLLTGAGGLLVGRSVAHCLLVESDDGLALVDTGFGTADVLDPNRPGPVIRLTARPRFDLRETALHQVRALGHDPRDVRHIVLTHLDPDHAGGLSDFPDAEVHVLTEELQAARKPANWRQAARYRAAQWAHNPKWVEHRTAGEQWFGFDATPVLPGNDDLLLVPLAGHTKGHTAVAVRNGDRWLLHCGDSYMAGGQLLQPPSVAPGMTFMQLLSDTDRKVRMGNQQRLRELDRDHGDEVRLFSAHDPHEFDDLSGGSRG